MHLELKAKSAAAWRHAGPLTSSRGRAAQPICTIRVRHDTSLHMCQFAHPRVSFVKQASYPQAASWRCRYLLPVPRGRCKLPNCPRESESKSSGLHYACTDVRHAVQHFAAPTAAHLCCTWARRLYANSSGCRWEHRHAERPDASMPKRVYGGGNTPTPAQRTQVQLRAGKRKRK